MTLTIKEVYLDANVMRNKKQQAERTMIILIEIDLSRVNSIADLMKKQDVVIP
jgi:hypothetical protein